MQYLFEQEYIKHERALFLVAVIRNDQHFYMNSSGNIVICFDEYEVAAGAQGCPEFEIPADVIKHIRKIREKQEGLLC